MKTFTARDIVDNIEKNGLPQTTGALFRKGKGDYAIYTLDSTFPTQIGAVCALGQAAINLGVKYSFVDETESLKESFLSAIVSLNDHRHLNFKDIAEAIRAEFGDQLDTIIFEAEEFNYSPFLPEGYTA